jgi:tetratricopeptide (TPR) repeat protein
MSNQFRNSVNASIELAKQGKNNEALELLNRAIDDSMSLDQANEVVTLCHHAAIIARMSENPEVAKNYYGQSLRASPGNPRALYGLAEIAREAGDDDKARKYAAQCYAGLIKSDDEMLRQGLLDLVEKHWPELAQEKSSNG